LPAGAALIGVLLAWLVLHSARAPGGGDPDAFGKAVVAAAGGVPVTARELGDAYAADPAAADRVYKERFLVVTGAVTCTIPSKDGDATMVALEAGGNPLGVCGRFKGDDLARAGALRLGDTVRFRGYCEGRHGQTVHLSLDTFTAGPPPAAAPLEADTLPGRTQRHPGMTLAAYLAERPSRPATVMVDANMGNYFNYAYQDAAATHYSLTVEGPYPFKHGHAWVRKDTRIGRRLLEVLKDGTTHPVLVEVDLRGPSGAPTPPGQEELAVVTDEEGGPAR
jgi:hypothetical protein